MSSLVRKVKLDKKGTDFNQNKLIYNEYLVTNGLGGYSSLTLSGTTSRKYHGLLVASLSTPLGRTVMLNFIQDQIRCQDGTTLKLSYQELIEPKEEEFEHLQEFRLEEGLPIWRYVFKDFVLEKTIFMPYRQNTVFVTYHLLEGPTSLKLSVQPFFNFRHHEETVSHPLHDHYQYFSQGSHFEVSSDGFPPLRILLPSEADFIETKEILKNVHYRIESERGYDSIGDLQSFGYFDLRLEPHQKVSFIASTEPWDIIQAISSVESFSAEKERRKYLLMQAEQVDPILSKEKLPQELILAADQFIITPQSRASDVAWTHAVGEEPRTIIAGYHWFTDWGRDSMISLEGLALITGRFQDASYILKMFAHHLRDGLIPNMFPDGQNQGVYYTVDATFWFIHALQRYVDYTRDEALVKSLLPKVKEILNYHVRGTRFGIRMDSNDALISQGQEGYALTWMDAKVGDLVVTPRRGKAVEINALWYNALRIASRWLEHYDNAEEASKFKAIADKCYTSFNQKFWFNEGGYLFDLIEGEFGNDDAFRPNQLWAFALDYPILEENRWKEVIDKVRDKLLTRVGLRTLSAEHPNYKVKYAGNLFLRDSAYHQGTTWAWLIGPYIDAWLKVYPDKIQEVHDILEGFSTHMNEGCIGSINEIFDASEPFTHRGCIAQAWSIAEVLRCWLLVSRHESKKLNSPSKLT